MPTIPWILFGTALTIFTSITLGSSAIRIGNFATPAGRLERYPLYFGLGAALLSNIVFLICVAQIVSPTVFAIVGGLALASAWFLRPETRLRSVNAAAKPGIVEWICGLIVLTYLAVYFVYAAAPEVMADAVTYHLGFTRRYLSHHGFPVITDNIYAFLPQGMEMLFLFAYSFGEHSAASLVHFATVVATVAALVGFATRRSKARAGWVAAVLYLCSPVVGLDASIAYNDCALAFFLFLVFVSFMDWLDDPSPQGAALVGALAGFCFALKYTGAVALLAGGLAVAWVSFRRAATPLRETTRNVASFGGAALFFVLPWVLKNVYVTGNPFSPLFNSLFPNPYVSPTWEAGYTDGLRHFNGFGREGFTDYLTAPLEVTIWGDKVTSIVGPVYLLFPIVLVAWRSPLVRSLVLAALVAALPWLGNAGTRFLIPVLPFAALAIAVSLERLPRFLPAIVGATVVTAHAVMCWHSVIVQWHPSYLWRLQSPVPWEIALQQAPAEPYLQYHVPTYDIGRRIDSVAEDGDRVFAFEQLPEAYMDTQVVVCYQGAIPERMFRNFWLLRDPNTWPTSRLTVRPGDPSKISGVRISTTNEVPGSEWALSEIQFFDGEVQLSPTPEWEVDVDPAPWDKRFLTDGDPATTWYSNTHLHPGMYAQVRFLEPLQVSEIRVIFPIVQRVAALRIEVGTVDGLWAPLSDEPVLDEAPLEADVLRQQASRELLLNDIDFVLLNTTGEGHNFIAPLITTDPAAWGLEEVFREGTYILYKVSVQ